MIRLMLEQPEAAGVVLTIVAGWVCWIGGLLR